MIRLAAKLAQNPKKLDIYTTTVVVLATLTMLPRQSDSVNWATNTMLLTTATSVPRPLWKFSSASALN